jgi:hypothetical protein
VGRGSAGEELSGPGAVLGITSMEDVLRSVLTRPSEPPPAEEPLKQRLINSLVRQRGRKAGPRVAAQVWSL